MPANQLTAVRKVALKLWAPIEKDTFSASALYGALALCLLSTWILAGGAITALPLLVVSVLGCLYFTEMVWHPMARLRALFGGPARSW